MPSSIYVSGKTIASPGVYTTVDTSGLDVTGLSATGIVGVIGTAVGGTPYTAINSPQDFVTITNPAQGSRLFQSGDLLEAVSVAFNPSSDTAIQGGAQAMVAMQVNPSTQASLALANGKVTLTSVNYGALSNQIKATLSDGSVSGQMVTISNGTLTEMGDNLSKADATGLVNWINANSQLITATFTAQASGGSTQAYNITSTKTGVDAGDVFSLTLNGVAYSHTAAYGEGPLANLQNLAAQINAGAQQLTATVSLTDPSNDQTAVMNVAAKSGVNLTVTALQTLSAVPITGSVTTGSQAPAALPNMAATPLAGGTDGQATFQDWQNCLNLLKQVRVNSIVVLTTDAAVHAAVDAHCAYMCGLGQSERDGFVGLATTQANGLPKRTEALNALKALNSYNIRACAERIQRYNSQGVLTIFPTYFTALAAAGMQAGAAPGVSLTRKRINALAVYRDKTWNLVDNKEEMLLAGLLFLENKTNVGIRWVRNVTTWTTDNNSAYSDGGVRNALNYSVYSLREAIDYAIGLESFAGTTNSIVAVASKELRSLIEQKVITAYRALAVAADPDAPDALLLSVQLAPTQPINFIKFAISLATATQIAAAA